MPWDPFGAWPAGRRWLWAALACWIGLFQGPAFLRSLAPQERAPDFFQEWASARFLFDGLPVYTDLAVAIRRYLGRPETPPLFVHVNAHPPTSVLLAVPFAPLDLGAATVAWNLFSLALFVPSLWLVARQLGVRLAWWSVFPAVTLLLLCNGFRQQVNLAQLNLVLLLLLTGVWAAERSGRWRTAGALLGAATAIKLFPGFLFVYFVLTRQWKVVAAGVVSLLALTALTAAVVGVDAYRVYVVGVMPQVDGFQSRWGNASLPGLWRKLFDPAPTDLEPTEPLWRSPALYRVGSLLCCLAVVAVLVAVTGRARTRAERDHAFGLTVTGMLLVSPITWNHGFLLLLVPLGLVWRDLPPRGPRLLLFLAVLVGLWLDPLWLYNAFIPGGHAEGVAAPVHTVTVVSLQCYALLGLFALGLMMPGRGA